ncbi:MAG: hypothetical protein F4Y63_07135 [Chloroflexi bacterium]|nr:hypothetical protein [Chloroflexota bacterium]
MPIYRCRRRVAGFTLGVAVLALVAAAWVAGSGAVRAAVDSDGAETPSVCANGTVITSPAANLGLVADCEALLAVKDALRGTASLNWSASLAISAWTGVTVGGEPRRVTALILDHSQLDGVIPAGLSRLNQLQELRLSSNRLTGSIPPALAHLRELTIFFAPSNQLSGALPAALGTLPKQRHLDLRDNRFAGSIPAAWADLWSLESLALQRNRLSGPVPAWLDDFSLIGLHLAGNSGLSGCIPAELRTVEFNDLARLGLTWCAALAQRSLTVTVGTNGGVAPGAGRRSYREGARVRLRALPNSGYRVASWGAACAGKSRVRVVTMDADRTVGLTFEVITYSLTASAGAGGTVTPVGRTSYSEPTTVTLRAAWNDATHSFSGWSGACSGATTTCELEVDDDLTVSAAFAPLPADRCATPTASDCIRAVFLGAPDDYAQVQDIPADRLLTPDDDGRYTIARGQQVTVVTAARLPANHNRFMPNVRPDTAVHPLAHLQLIRPVGTTFSLTASSDAYAPDRFQLDLHAARIRPGNSRPIPGPLAVTTRFNVRPDPLALELTSSRELCTANTLTELSWTITGGKPPYRLTIDGQTVAATADSHRVNCGPIPTESATGDPVDTPTKTFTATVTDSQPTPATAASGTDVELAPALPAATNVGVLAFRTSAGATWQAPSIGAGQTPVTHYLVRRKRVGASIWSESYQPHVSERQLNPQGYLAGLDSGSHYQFAVAAMREPLEAETPEALQWTSPLSFFTTSTPTGISASSTHDSITVNWNGQSAPSVHYSVTVGSAEGGQTEHVWLAPSDPHAVTIRNLPPDTEHRVIVTMHAGDETVHVEAPAPVRTQAAPTTWQEPVRGPVQLSGTATADSITVRWQHPRVDASTSYIVYLFDGTEETRPLRHILTHDGTAVRFEDLSAGQTYRVKVVHLDGVSASQELEVSTLNATGTSKAARSAARQVSDGMVVSQPAQRFGWPVHFDVSRYLTDDMWAWRGHRHHGGMDVGHRRGGAYVESRKDPLLASADGVIRLFNEDVRQTHYFCPGLSGPFHQRFLPAGDTRLGELLEENECNYVATSSSGITAIIAHGANGEGPYITKYAHLSEVDLEPGVLARPVHGAGQEPAYRIRRGERIGYIGGSGGESRYPAHVHFEIRRMPITAGGVKLWYGTGPGSMKCAGAPPYVSYCGWHPERFLISFLDPEELLPPQPPTWPGSSSRAFEVHSVERANDDPRLIVTVRAQVDVPRFYPPGSGTGGRRHLVGLEATRPGVTRYFLDTSCESGGASTEHPRATNGTDGVLNRTLRLASATVCDLQLGSLNPTYRFAGPPIGSYGRTIDPSDNDGLPWGTPVVIRTGYARPRGPSSTLTLTQPLLNGAALLSGSRSLSADAHDLYEFVAVPGLTYRFCVTQNTASTECLDESSASSVTELLIVGPAETGQSGVATTGLTRDAAGLQWRVPDPADAVVETHAVVVRRRARYEGGVVPDYTYRLKYTNPEIPECEPPELGGLLVRFCVPQAPVISGVTGLTNSGFSVGFGARYSATGYEVELTVDDITTVYTVMNVDASASSHSHPFSGLGQSTTHHVRVRAVNATGPSAWSASRTVTTLGAQCPRSSADDGTSTSSSAQCPTAASVTIAAAAIAGNGIVNAAERAAEFSITGTATAGAEVTLTVGQTALPAVTADAQGAWSATVPANASYVTEGTLALSAVAAKTGLTDGRARARLIVDLTAPSVSYTSPASLTVGVEAKVSPTTSDTDIASYARASGPTLPAGLSLDAMSGVISGTPTQVGPAKRVNLLVSDRAENSMSTSVSLPAVAKGSQILTGFGYTPNPISLDNPVTSLTSPNGAEGTLSYTSSPTIVCTVNSSTGALNVLSSGTCVITASAAATTNYLSATTSTTVTITPRSAGQALAITRASTTWQHCVAAVGRVPVSWTVTGGVKPYTVAGVAQGASVGSGTVQLDCPASSGTGRLTLSVSDSAVPPASESRQLSITATKALALAPATLTATCTTGTASTITLTPSGGASPYSVSATGLTLTARSGHSYSYTCPTALGITSHTVSVSDASRPQQRLTRTLRLTSELQRVRFEARIQVRKLSNGNVEFCLRLRPDSNCIEPTRRILTPSEMVDNRWYNSSMVSHTFHGHRRTLGQISARKASANANIEVAFAAAGVIDRIFPTGRYFNWRTATVDNWTSSSWFNHTLDGDDYVERNLTRETAGAMVAPSGAEADSAGRDGGDLSNADTSGSASDNDADTDAEP